MTIKIAQLLIIWFLMKQLHFKRSIYITIQLRSFAPHNLILIITNATHFIYYIVKFNTQRRIIYLFTVQPI